MEIFPEALMHFQKLLQFNTANPPGNEAECVGYISETLRKGGLEPQIMESAPGRANLVVRLKGNGSHKPLLLTSHIDVVNVEADKWKHPPFSGAIAENCVWGRGAVDMKNMTTYCLMTVLHLARQKAQLKRDVIMSVVADEEVGGDYGMGFLVKNYPQLLDAEFALGELGGYTLFVGSQRFYPIQVGEKGIFWIKVKFRGDPGHGSIPKYTNAHYQLSKFLKAIEEKPMPIHLTETSQVFFQSIQRQMKGFGKIPYRILPTSMGLKILRNKQRKDPDKDRYAALEAMLTNSVNPTGCEAGKQMNVVPSQVILNLDCRTLPGFQGTDIIAELKELTKMDFEYEIVREGAGHESSFDTELFRHIKKNVEAADLGATAIPTLTVGYTDAQHLKKLGVTCYGFTPIKMPADMSFAKLYHGHNERIPVEGFKWGLEVFMKTVQEFAAV